MGGAVIARARSKELADLKWDQQAELLLEEAFLGPVPRDAFREAWPYGGGLGFLAELEGRLPQLEYPAARRPYWTQRHQPIVDEPSGWIPTTKAFIELVEKLEAKGYLEQHLTEGCPHEVCADRKDPSSVLKDHLGVPNLWPLSKSWGSGWGEDLFYGLLEVVHDLVSRPRLRVWHDHPARDHYDYRGFTVGPARVLYRWEVNRLLAAGGLPYRLADQGEDEGRLVSVPGDEARAELVEKMAARGREDLAGHAVALFRARESTEQDRRAAVRSLADVLEGHKKLLHDNAPDKDISELFHIANRFDIRHHDLKQCSDYDPAYLDWLFYWYLATVELAETLVAKQVPA
jgi:hypothetical protein